MQRHPDVHIASLSAPLARAKSVSLGSIAAAVALVFVVATGQAPRAADTRPRLVVLLVVDQMRADYLERYASAFKDGFKRLAEGGAVFSEARYPYASTKTAEAHALMLSGWSPSGTGIIGDSWLDRRTGRMVIAASAPEHKLLGSPAEGGSPEQMLVHTLGDALKEKDRRTIVLTASWKRYTSVLTGGRHADAAFWFDPVTGHIVTSDYYLSAYPEWAKPFSDRDVTAPFFSRPWLSHTLSTATAPDEAYRTSFRATSYANDVLPAFTRALIDGSGVGKDDVPDVLAVSFSGLDYVGHEYGPETPEFDATIEALDHQIGDLLRELDAKVGTGRYTVALTADHGAALVPERERERGHDAGRLHAVAFRKAVETAVRASLHVDIPVILAFESPELYANYALAAARGIGRAALDRALVDAIQAQPGIARAYTVDDVLGAAGSADPLLKAVAAGYYADRSGDIHVLVKPGYIFWDGGGTTHGTPYDYDAHVPLILFGAGVAPGRQSNPVRINELAPTLGQLAGIVFKGDIQGRVLTEALQPWAAAPLSSQ